MKKVLFSSFVSMLIALFCVGFIQKPAMSEEITLKGVHFLPAFMSVSKDFIELTKRINKQTKGELNIKIAGGPEILPPPDMAEALRKGIIDALMCPTEYYDKLLPEASVFHLGTLTAAQERKSGFHDFMVERHKTFGIYYVGRTRAYDPFFVYLKNKITKLSDFKGMKIGRSAPLGANLYKALGATVVTLQAGDFYSGLEKGVVDGVGHPSDGIPGLSLGEVAKYVLDEPVYIRNSTVFLMNLEKYNSLSPKLQKIINDTTIAWEKERIAIDPKRVATELSLGKKQGVKFIKFSKADSKKFADEAMKVEWDIIKKNQPDLYPKLKKLLNQK